MLRLMTYNILNGGIGREEQILKVIQNAKPDVLVLQEVYSEDVLKFLSDALNMQYYFGKGNKRRKVACLSKLPVLSFKSVNPAFPIWRNIIDVEVETPVGQRVRVIGVHPIAMLGVFFEIWRLWEAKYVIQYIQSLHEDYVVIAGDFNAIAPGEHVQTETMPKWLKWMIYLQGNRVYHFSIKKYLSAGLTDCFRICNPNDKGFTLPPVHPNARLDYVLASEKMKHYLKSATVLHMPDEVKVASDHLPLVVDFLT